MAQRVAPRNMVLIAALVCGGFGIGVSEFLVMGLLPQIAADLLSALNAQHADAALAATGGLASAYGLGVMTGALLTPPLIARLSERKALLLLATTMLLGTAATALAPTLAVALVFRFLSALAHASYIGVGAMAIAHLLGSARYGRGSAIVHGGLAGATLIGVPALTALGAVSDWRILLGGCALLFAIPLVALLAIRIPAGPPVSHGAAAPKPRPLRVLTIIGAAVLSSAGGFAIVTYIAPVTASTRGSDAWLTAAWAMLTFGIGMNLGNLVAGWFADRAADLAFWGAVIAGAAGAALLLLLELGAGGAGSAPGAAGGVWSAVGVLFIGLMLGGCGPAGQVLYLRELARFPRLASSMPSGAGNLGSFLGALAGGAILAGSGVTAIPVGALALIAVGVLLLVGYRLARRGA